MPEDARDNYEPKRTGPQVVLTPVGLVGEWRR